MNRMFPKLFLVSALALPLVANAMKFEVSDSGAKTSTHAQRATFQDGQVVSYGDTFLMEAVQSGMNSPIIPSDFALGSSTYKNGVTVVDSVSGLERYEIDVTFRALTADPLKLALTGSFDLSGNWPGWGADPISYYSSATERLTVYDLAGNVLFNSQHTSKIKSGGWSDNGYFELNGLPNEFRLVHSFALTAREGFGPLTTGKLAQNTNLEYSWNANGYFTPVAAPVPEPSTYLLLLAGLLPLVISKRRRV